MKFSCCKGYSSAVPIPVPHCVGDPTRRTEQFYDRLPPRCQCWPACYSTTNLSRQANIMGQTCTRLGARPRVFTASRRRAREHPQLPQGAGLRPPSQHGSSNKLKYKSDVVGTARRSARKSLVFADGDGEGAHSSVCIGERIHDIHFTIRTTLAVRSLGGGYGRASRGISRRKS